MNKLTVVNFAAAPGSGKSTSAAQCFAYFKNRGANVELLNEYAKQLVYSRRQAEMGNQVYMLGKQYKKQMDIAEYGKVPMVFTDSPLFLGLLYSEHLSYFTELKAITYALYYQFDNINVLVNRVKPYNPSGRNQTEEESDALQSKVKALGLHFDYEINGDEAGQIAFAQKLFAKRLTP